MPLPTFSGEGRPAVGVGAPIRQKVTEIALSQLIVFATYCIIHDCIGAGIPTARAATITNLHRNDDAAEYISAICILSEGRGLGANQELTFLA
jgi:hypothetical protein